MIKFCRITAVLILAMLPGFIRSHDLNNSGIMRSLDLNKLKTEYDFWRKAEEQIECSSAEERPRVRDTYKSKIAREEETYGEHLSNAYDSVYYRHMSQQVSSLSELEYRQYITLLDKYCSCITRINGISCNRSELFKLLAFMARDIRGDTFFWDKIWWMRPAHKMGILATFVILGCIGYAIYDEKQKKDKKKDFYSMQ